MTQRTPAPKRALDRGVVGVLVDRVGETFSLEADDETERLRKAVMTSSVLLICIGGVVWAVAYAVLGDLRSASIPLAYVVLSIINIAVLYWTKADRFFLVSQLVLILMLPFMLQWSAGGFVPSGAVMLWAVLAPVGALMFHGVRESLWWFLAYVVLVLFSAAVDPRLDSPVADLSQGQIAVSFAFNVIMVSTILFLLLRYFVAANEEANQRSEELLSNILPDAIAERLKRGERPIADRIETASIVFADVVNFTPLSESVSATEIVEWLDRIFDGFDSLADEAGLEKIKTVGDAYIVASGVPTVRADHAEAAADMALAMREHLAQVEPPPGQPHISMRFGIHCGPVIAGVIGTRKLAYSVWGSTVNIASRMESQGQPNRIQVSSEVMDMLIDSHTFEDHGMIEIKGHGPMRTFFLEGRRQPAS
ncbi:MAG: adenylate/guanylate cyclase domain-containing protein [Acidimicrobiia bacterium]